MLIQQNDLIQQNGAQCAQLTPLQAFDRHLATPGKDVFEHPVARLNGQRPSLMTDPSAFDAPIPLGRRATTCGDQFPLVQRTVITQLGGLVMGVTEDVPHPQRPWLQQLWGDHLVSLTGDGKLRGQGEPDAADRDGHMELPAVPPAMIPGLAPGGCGVHRGMWAFPCEPMLLVPDAPVGTQGRTVDSCRVALRGPGLQPLDQMAAQTPEQGGQPGRQLLKASFPGAPRGKTPMCSQQGPKLLRDWIVLCEKVAQRLGRRESPNDHDDECFDQELIGRGLLPSALAFGGGRWCGNRLDEPE
jgi:hypothetical protein